MRGRFRLGTTSYIVPDDILPNVRFLASRVDDIELLLFESDEMSNLPTPEVLDELRTIAVDADLTFTVHFPLDADLGAFDESQRRSSVGKCLRVIELTARLDPAAYVVHFHGDLRGGEGSVDPPRWLEALDRSALEILQRSNRDPRSFCVETLDYPFEMIEPSIQRHDLSICLDVGHLRLYGRDLVSALDRLWDRVRVVHLHGVDAGRDHLGLQVLDDEGRGWLVPLFDRLRETEGSDELARIVTLEVFNEEDLTRSLPIVEELS